MRVNRASWVILAAAIACSAPSDRDDDDEEPEPDYIGPCVAYQESAVVLPPSAGCFRVETREGSFGPRGIHPCETNLACVVIEYSGSGDSGWSWYHGRDDGTGAVPGTLGPQVTEQACGTRC